MRENIEHSIQIFKRNPIILIIVRTRYCFKYHTITDSQMFIFHNDVINIPVLFNGFINVGSLTLQA